jgi:cell division septal protein FtsQ
MIDRLTPKESRDKGKSKALRHVLIYLLIFAATVVVVQYIMSLE